MSAITTWTPTCIESPLRYGQGRKFPSDLKAQGSYIRLERLFKEKRNGGKDAIEVVKGVQDNPAR